ncbi:hypothetical protein B0H14DRAFT_3507483 [Mycena olivaceomarginata]|nr:hypothetical protein B0H14DRAFT_3525471 [Mycena olivaceomarginata]KAJ7780888.1 hypothetical protein B0H14DRAFT_3507483 [Mycena olivaceomarginata]
MRKTAVAVTVTGGSPTPKSSRHGSLDGAYFGTTFPHLLYLVYPTLLPPKTKLEKAP